jgi:hypothetical protein
MPDWFLGGGPGTTMPVWFLGGAPGTLMPDWFLGGGPGTVSLRAPPLKEDGRGPAGVFGILANRLGFRPAGVLAILFCGDGASAT